MERKQKVYFLLWGVISLSIMLIAVLGQHDLDILYFWLFWLGGCVMIPGLFSRWSDFGRSSLYLLLPASSLEKFLCGPFLRAPPVYSRFRSEFRIYQVYCYLPGYPAGSQ